MNIDISFVITVFNKSKYLPAMLDSILRQTGSLACEYIFIDDASYDDSVNIIKETFKGTKNCTILTNTQNIGPSISLNKGCRVASGEYLFLIDADDILAQNALNIMLSAIKTEDADFVFGGHKNTEKDQQELLSINLPTDNKTNYTVSSNPLDTVLKGRYVRMAYLVNRELYLKSNGADERIFIQDESLPLKLAYHAKKMITLNDIAVYAPKREESLSSNKFQQIHDRFYAYYFALSEFKDLTTFQKAEIYKRAVSSVWKAKKKSKNLKDKLFFITYLKTKYRLVDNDDIMMENLNRYKNFIDSLDDVRKIY